MQISLILAHPEPGSFNHAIAAAARTTLEGAGHTVHFHDLYQEGFDPFLRIEEIPKNTALPDDIQTHCDEIASADGIIIVHPNWWGMPPAVLKGWVDRIFRPEVAYRFVEGDSGEGVPQGLLKAETAIVFNTGNTSIEREINEFGDPLERIWKHCIFGLCGVQNFRRRLFTIVITSSLEQRSDWLDEVKAMTAETFPPSH